MNHVGGETYTDDNQFTEGLRVLRQIAKERKKIPSKMTWSFEGEEKVFFKKAKY